MKQIWVSRKGAPEVLDLRDVPVPEPGNGEIRIRVRAAGVNFSDNLMRMGVYPGAPKPPMVPGWEVSGVVDAIGSNAEGFREGDRVMAYSERLGCYSECVNVPTVAAVKVPERMTDEQAAALPVVHVTAYMMLVRLANVQSGERVLIHSAAGGVGLALLQLCRWKGAEPIGTASAAKHSRLKELGCAHCIDYRTQDVEAEVRRFTDGHGVDIVMDSLGGANLRQSYRLLAPLGRLLTYGAGSMAPKKKADALAFLLGVLRMPRFNPLDLMSRNKSVLGFWLGKPGVGADKVRGAFEEVTRLAAEGVLDPIVDRTFPFAEAAQAHHYMQDRRNFGKLLLVP